MSIHTFGDSHSHLGFESVNINGVSIITHWIGPVLCYTFGNNKLDLLDISNYGVKDGDTVIFCFGEIDCRAHVYRFVNETNTYENIIDNLVNNYFEAISENVKKYTRLNTLVYNVVPPANVFLCHPEEQCAIDVFTKNKTEVPWKGRNEDRMQYHLYFNKKLKELCLSYNYTFMDVYDKYCDADGFINSELSDKNVHIKDPIFIKDFLVSYIHKDAKTFYYLNDLSKPIKVTNDTCRLTPHTFSSDNSMAEEDILRMFFSYVPTDKQINIIDCGAQSGLYSLYAKYLPNATFYSFEPFITTFQLLNDNICINDIRNVNTYNIGLSDRIGSCILNTCVSHNGLHTIGNNVRRFNDIKPIEIQVNTIDNLFYDKNIQVDFIKIDTEGWEYFILKGGEKTIRKYKPKIQIEWFETNMIQCNVNVNEFINYINSIGYRIEYKSGSEMLIVPVNMYLKNDDYAGIPSHIKNIKIDIGMGMWNIHSLDWLSKDKNMFLMCFEPNIDSRNSCTNYLNRINNAINANNNAYAIIPVALSNVETPTDMKFYSMLEDGGTSSLYEPVDPRLGPVKSHLTVPVYSLKHFFDVFPWDRFEYIEYIKIDAQGADFDIIKGAGDYLKEKVVFITAEPENAQYKDCNHNTAENMNEYLRSQGFIRIVHPNTSDPTFLNIKYNHLYDKIYIRQIS